MTENERGKELESAANEIIKNNKKFWVGYISGVITCVVIAGFYLAGKILG